MRLLVIACLVSCWHDAPAPRAPENAGDPGGPPPETRLVRADPPAPSDRFSQLFADFQSFVDQMCQCTDNACGVAVMNAMQKWYEPMMNDPDVRNFKPTDAQLKEMGDLSKRFSDCFAKAMSGGSGSTMPTP